MRKKIAISLSILLAFVFLALVTQVHAEEEHNPWVSTWDATDATIPRDVFNQDEDVRVKAYNSPTKGPYDLILRYPDGSTTSLASGLTGYHEAVYPGATMTPSLGGYTIYAGSACVGYATGLYTVVPELPLGTIMATVACFGAVAGLATTKRLRLKK